MARRRNHNNPFNMAKHHVGDLETRVLRATVPIPFDMENVLECLFDADVIKTLRRAYNMANAGRYTGNLSVTLSGHVTMQCDMHACNMLVPHATAADFKDRPGFGVINDTFLQMRQVELEFERVRTLIDKVEKWTPTAIKYYFPSLCALLPPGSPVHEADGTPREPRGLASLLPDLREAAATIASALMCPTILEPRKVFSVGFWRGDMGPARYHGVL